MLHFELLPGCWEADAGEAPARVPRSAGRHPRAWAAHLTGRESEKNVPRPRLREAAGWRLKGTGRAKGNGKRGVGPLLVRRARNNGEAASQALRPKFGWSLAGNELVVQAAGECCVVGKLQGNRWEFKSWGRSAKLST